LKDTDVLELLEEPAASIFRVEKWRLNENGDSRFLL
jgi:hypothetical protein